MANLVKKSSNFAQTCNLLSQYMKERGSFGDINLGINGKGPETYRPPPTTMNLLPTMEDSVEASPNPKSIDFLPQFTSFSSPTSGNEEAAGADLRKQALTDPATAPMTIFYAGKLIVFDDFPAEKAKEIMAFAGKEKSYVNTEKKTSNLNNVSVVPGSNVIAQEQIQLRPKANASDLPIARRVSLHRFLEKRKERVDAVTSDLPIARRASLHRFLEKRRDRAATRTPYQISKPSSPSRSSATQKSDESHLRLDLEAESSLELRL